MNRIAKLLLLASSAMAQPSYDLLLKGGHVIDPKNKIDAVMDVAVANGKIAAVGANIPAAQAKQTVAASGFIVTPGLIDIHVHVFQRPEDRSVERDSSIQADAHTFRSRLRAGELPSAERRRAGIGSPGAVDLHRPLDERSHHRCAVNPREQ